MARNDALLKIQNTLAARRTELRKRLGVELDQMGFGQSTSATGDAADAAFESAGEELASQLAELESKELSQIDHALHRIKQGKYGECAGCNGKIPVSRLSILPYSVLCIACQREAEKDSHWYENRVAADWNKVRDAGEDRHVHIGQLELDLRK